MILRRSRGIAHVVRVYVQRILHMIQTPPPWSILKIGYKCLWTDCVAAAGVGEGEEAWPGTAACRAPAHPRFFLSPAAIRPFSPSLLRTFAILLSSGPKQSRLLRSLFHSVTRHLLIICSPHWRTHYPAGSCQTLSRLFLAVNLEQPLPALLSSPVQLNLPSPNNG